MHISDQVAQALINDGWIDKSNTGTFRKRIVGFAEAGTISDGARVVTLSIDVTGRWFERLDGWGKVEKDLDLRCFDDAKVAISEILA